MNENCAAIPEEKEQDRPLGVEVEQSDATFDLASIDKPFDPDKIKVYRETKTISLLCTRIKHDEIDLAPEFQRRARIWDQGRKSKLIESILLRIPLPVFYVASDLHDAWSVVDGLQRLTTIYDYFHDDFPLRGLEYLTQLHNSRFSDLPRNMQRRIEETELVINIIQPGTPEEVMFNIFKRINTGGITLNSQEIRHALNKGPVRDFLKELVSLDEYQSATARSISDIRMSARECALRFLAFHLTNWRDYKTNDLDGFLSAAMKAVNEADASCRSTLKSTFASAMSASHAVFGQDAFRKRYHTNGPRSPISKALFETWSVTLASLDFDSVDQLVSVKGQVQMEFRDRLLSDHEFEVSISYATGVPARVHKRFSTVENIVEKVLGNA